MIQIQRRERRWIHRKPQLPQKQAAGRRESPGLFLDKGSSPHQTGREIHPHPVIHQRKKLVPDPDTLETLILIRGILRPGDASGFQVSAQLMAAETE